VTEFPWVSVSGFGARITSTRKNLIIQKRKTDEIYPLDSVKHLLIVGGHFLSSATVNQLTRQGSCISFFEPDGTPVGTIRPFGKKNPFPLRELQQEIPRQRNSIIIAQASMRSRIFSIEKTEELSNAHLLYEGELEILQKSHDEVAYLIKLEEIWRLHRLASDMYYEIMARNLPAELGFRRRTLRPQMDPVNAMLSFGYALLFGTCSVAVTGAGLDPDVGFLHEGDGSLVHDLIEPLKAGMVDPIVFHIAKESLKPADFEISQERCLLSDDLMQVMIKSFYSGINTENVNNQVLCMKASLEKTEEFRVQY
jgi:CRISPR-associated endonuclease Cas1